MLADGAPEPLARGIALYRGNFLDGLIVDEPPFEDWLRNHRQQLHEGAVQGLSRLLALQHRAGDTETAIQTALRSLALDSFQEPVHRDLMQLYAEAGRPGAAFQQYRACVNLLPRRTRRRAGSRDQRALRAAVPRARPAIGSAGPRCPTAR